MEPGRNGGHEPFCASVSRKSFGAVVPFLKTLTKKEILTLIALLVFGSSLRIYFWQQTHLTLEDSLITFRYAENLAGGNGFVYNNGERVLGTTTPLWTLLLAATKVIGLPDLFSTSKMLSIFFDSLTLVLLFLSILRTASWGTALIGSVLFAVSPDLIPIHISGMETSLLILMMTSALLGWTTRSSLFSLSLALVVLTRIDGVLFVICLLGAAAVSDRHWATRQIVLLILFLLPSVVFCWIYFGSFVPQSLLAKMVAYRFDLWSSAQPFLAQFTPVGETHWLKFALKTLLLVTLMLGFVRIISHYRSLSGVGIFFLVYCIVYMISRTVIFRWYLAPPIFASYVIFSAGIDYLLSITDRLPVKKIANSLMALMLVGLLTVNLILMNARSEKYRQLQTMEEELRKEIGLWLRENVTPSESVFLEPIGYIGYYAGTRVRIIDEIGIVSPLVTKFRKSGGAWYIKAVRSLQPDYIVQYAYSLIHDRLEGTDEPMFSDDAEKDWFFKSYRIVTTISAKSHYDFINEKEKEYVILRRLSSPTSVSEFSVE